MPASSSSSSASSSSSSGDATTTTTTNQTGSTSQQTGTTTTTTTTSATTATDDTATRMLRGMQPSPNVRRSVSFQGEERPAAAGRRSPSSSSSSSSDEEESTSSDDEEEEETTTTTGAETTTTATTTEATTTDATTTDGRTTESTARPHTGGSFKRPKSGESSSSSDEEESSSDEETSSDEEEESSTAVTGTSSGQTGQTTTEATTATTSTRPTATTTSAEEDEEDEEEETSSEEEDEEEESTTEATTTTTSAAAAPQRKPSGKKPAAAAAADRSASTTTDATNTSSATDSSALSSVAREGSVPSKPSSADDARPAAAGAPATASAKPKPPSAEQGGKRKPPSRWNAARGAVTGDEVTEEAAAEAASSARGADGAPRSLAKTDSGAPAPTDTTARPTDAVSKTEVPTGAGDTAVTSPTDPAVLAATQKKPHRYAHDTDSTDEEEETTSAEETSDEEEEEETESTTVSSSHNVVREASANSQLGSGLNDTLRPDQAPAAPAKRAPNVQIERQTVVVDTAAENVPRLHVSRFADAPALSAQPPSQLGGVMSTINAGAQVNRSDVALALRACGLEGPDAVKIGSRMPRVAGGRRASTSDAVLSTDEAAHFVRRHATEHAVGKFRRQLEALDPFQSGEVPLRSLQQLVGGIDGFTAYARAGVTMTIDVGSRRFVVASDNRSIQPTDVSLEDVADFELSFDRSGSARLTGGPSSSAPAFTRSGSAGAEHKPFDLAAFSQLRDVARAIEASYLGDGLIEYNEFFMRAVSGPLQADLSTASGVPRPQLDSLAAHVLQPASRLERVRDDTTYPPPFLWSFFRDRDHRAALAVPPIEHEDGVAHFVRREADDAAKFTNVLKMERVSLHGLLRDEHFPEDATPFCLAALIRADNSVTPPARLRAFPDREDRAVWNFVTKRGPKPRLFFMADATDLLYIEFCIINTLADEPTPMCVGYCTIEVGGLMQPDDDTPAAGTGQPDDPALRAAQQEHSVAMWVNGGTFYARQRPDRAAAATRVKGGGCLAACGGGMSADEVLTATGTVTPLPRRLFAADAEFDTVRLRNLPRNMVCPVFHLPFLIAVRRQMQVQNETVACFMVLRQEPFRFATEIIVDHEKLDIAALRWQEICVNHAKVMRDAPDAEVRRQLCMLAGDLFGLMEVGGADQQFERIYAKKGEVKHKVALQADADMRPAVHALGLLSTHSTR